MFYGSGYMRAYAVLGKYTEGDMKKKMELSVSSKRWNAWRNLILGVCFGFGFAGNCKSAESWVGIFSWFLG